MTQKQKPSETLKKRVKNSGITLSVLSERSNIAYPRLRSLVNGSAKMLFDEGVQIEEALKESVNVLSS